MSYDKNLRKDWRKGRNHWLKRQKQKYIIRGFGILLLPFLFIFVFATVLNGAIKQDELAKRALRHANQNATLLVQDVAFDNGGKMFVLADKNGIPWSVEVMCDPEGCDFAGWTPSEAAYRHAAEQEFLRTQSMSESDLFDDDF